MTLASKGTFKRLPASHTHMDAHLAVATSTSTEGWLP